LILSKDEILSKLHRRIETVHVEEFGGDVLFREMSIRERSDFNKRVFAEVDDKTTPLNFVVALVATTLCDEQGNRLFTEEDVENLRDQSELNLLVLVEHAKRVNGLGKPAIEEAEKNLEPIQKGE
jgi:hypothetical protein